MSSIRGTKDSAPSSLHPRISQLEFVHDAVECIKGEARCLVTAVDPETAYLSTDKSVDCHDLYYLGCDLPAYPYDMLLHIILLKIARVGWVCCPFFTLSCFAAPYRQCFTQCASIFHGLSLSGVSCGVHLHTNARWRMCVCMCLCVCVWVFGAYVCVNWVYVIKDVLCCGFDSEFWLKKKIYIFI